MPALPCVWSSIAELETECMHQDTVKWMLDVLTLFPQQELTSGVFWSSCTACFHGMPDCSAVFIMAFLAPALIIPHNVGLLIAMLIACETVPVLPAYIWSRVRLQTKSCCRWGSSEALVGNHLSNTAASSQQQPAPQPARQPDIDKVPTGQDVPPQRGSSTVWRQR